MYAAISLSGMPRPRHRFVTVAAVAFVALASACNGDNEPDATPAPTAAPVASPTATTSLTPSETATATVVPTTPAPPTTATNDDATVIDLKVAGGKVTGGQKTVKVKLGSKVRLVVTSDVADEVHLHTYDKKQDIEAGGTATLEFVANIPGQIPVELEKRKLTLVTLNIQ